MVEDLPPPAFDGLAPRARLEYDLRRGHLGLVNRHADLRQQPDVDLLNARHLVVDLVGHLVGHDGVDLAHVRDGVLARGGLGAHGPVERDHAVHLVPASHLPGVAALRRGAGDREVHAAQTAAGRIQRVDVQVDLTELLLALDTVHHGVVQGGLALEVGGLAVDEAVYHGHRDGDMQFAALAVAHDFDVLAGLRGVLLKGAGVQQPLDLKDRLLGRRQRRVPYRGRGVVRGGGLTGEDVHEFGRAGLDLHVVDDVLLGIDEAQVVANPGLRGARRDVTHGHLFAVPDGRGAVAEDQAHGIGDPAAAQPDLGIARYEKCLVDVVVEDPAEAILVFLAEGDGHALHDGVTDRIRMPHALALDDLDLMLGNGRSVQYLNGDVAHSHPPSMARASHAVHYTRLARERTATATLAARGEEPDQQRARGEPADVRPPSHRSHARRAQNHH